MMKTAFEGKKMEEEDQDLKCYKIYKTLSYNNFFMIIIELKYIKNTTLSYKVIMSW